MKQALLIGCGNTRGAEIVNGCEEAGYCVTNIGSGVSEIPTVQNIQIQWDDLDITQLHKILKNIKNPIDFVSFNQNASSLSHNDFIDEKKTLDTWALVKSWSKSYWLSCQLPYVLLQTLGPQMNKDSTVGWMLSSYTDKTAQGVEQHPDYSGYKFTNYLVMKNFSKKYNCFGINPDFEKNNFIKSLIKDICLGNTKCNGEVF